MARGDGMRWSVDGQTPEFLAATRMISLSDEIVGKILGQLRLEPGMRVLDVGCGSGEYCFRLGANVEGVSFTGAEYDARFVDFATRRALGEVPYPFEQPNAANDYRFVCADGLALPFSDGEFDAVVSHTYLTAIADWQGALAEMARVCKPGGTVSSITSMTGDFYGSGVIGLFTVPVGERETELLMRLDAKRSEVFDSMDLTPGIAPRFVPTAFDRMGLRNVRCMPLAHYFCLSDAATGEGEYRRYVDLLCAMEREQLERLAPDIAEEDYRACRDLIERRRNRLLEQIGCNREWDWYGNTSLLVCGEAPLE